MRGGGCDLAGDATVDPLTCKGTANWDWTAGGYGFRVCIIF